MLREADIEQDFAQLASNFRLGNGVNVRRRGWIVAAIGVGIQVAGVVLGAYASDPGQTAGGAAHSSTRASHALLLIGLAVAAFGAFVAVAGPRLRGPAERPSVRRRLLSYAALLSALAVIGAGVTAMDRVVFGGNSGTIVNAGVPAPLATAPVVTAVPANPDVAAAASLPDQPLDPATRAKLAHQLTLARQIALQYPTAADALKAGMYLAGGFAPGSGAHYMWMAGVFKGIQPDGEVDPLYPASFIYDGTSPNSRIVGLMYISLASTAPAGFAGPNDRWHRHFNVCVVYGGGTLKVPFPADSDVTEAQCASVQGQFMKQTVWMLHTWVVPGWESPQGVFSHSNPDLRCADGTFDTDEQGFCQGT